MSRVLSKLGISHLFLFWLLVQNSVFAYDASGEVRAVVDSYLSSISTGDVNGIRSVLGGRLLKRSERQLANSENYGAFLRKHYQGVQMAISTVEPSANQYMVRVIFYYNGESEVVTFYVAGDTGDWRIVDEKL